MLSSISEWYKLEEVKKEDVIKSVNTILKQDTVIFDPIIFTKYPNDYMIDAQDIQEYDVGIMGVSTRISRVNNSMRKFMQELQSMFADRDQNKLRTLKNHHNQHYDDNIKNFAAAPNFNAGCNEQNMKSQVTQPSQKTQGKSRHWHFKLQPYMGKT